MRSSYNARVLANSDAHISYKCSYYYTLSQKKGDTIPLSISLLNINRFSQFFHRRTQLELCNKIINKDPTVPPHLRCVATLPCEMLKNHETPLRVRFAFSHFAFKQLPFRKLRRPPLTVRLLSAEYSSFIC